MPSGLTPRQFEVLKSIRKFGKPLTAFYKKYYTKAAGKTENHLFYRNDYLEITGIMARSFVSNRNMVLDGDTLVLTEKFSDYQKEKLCAKTY